MAKRGKVYLVGAGPGDPGLLTVRAKTLLEQAEVVLYDALISAEILALIPTQAVRIYAGKRSGMHSLPQEEITALLAQQVEHYGAVIRLKGGDPFLFGRGGEELLALRALGIEVEVVPGITAGMAAPAYLGVPLSHRGVSSSVALVTGHEGMTVQWRTLAHSVETIVVYMGIQQLPLIVEELLAAGKAPTTPILLIRWGTTPREEHLVSTLAEVVGAAVDFAAPAVVVIGEVVSLGAFY